MHALEAIIDDIHGMEEAIRELKSRLQEMPAKMALEIPEQAERIEAARYLYWMVQEVSRIAIAEGLLGVRLHEMGHLIGTTLGAIPCDRCSTPMVFRSRTHLQEAITAGKQFRLKGHVSYAERYVVLCDPCWEDVQQVRHKEWEAAEAERQARLSQLSTMPYSEYLQTPES